MQNLTFSRLLNVTALTLMSLTVAACSKSNHVSKQASNNLVPAPVSVAKGEPLSLRDQLSRFRGQTEFANVDVMSAPGGGRAESASANDAGGGGPRAEQESDIFKIGKPGSKLLFLLNNSRGLQVVSFEKGADQPELLGRVNATGNYPDDMYYDAKRDRLLVLERLYNQMDSLDYNEMQSRILVYDVSQPSSPRLTSVVSVKGEVADSRMVGNVLYVASSLRPNMQWNQNEKNKGLVTSFDLSQETVKQVATYELALPAVYGNQMNIQTVTNKDGSYSYYLVAVLSETGWGWWDRQSLVEVVEITDASGNIRPVMSVSAKGFLRERSQTVIKDGVLIATSNYTVPNLNRRDETQSSEIARIAVETFRLPNSASEIITEKEAQFRQLHIERELGKLPESQRVEAQARLSADKDLGVANRFVKVGEKLRKVAADSVVTVGDTTGLSSSLQDVRYQDGLLYAFWVPANMVDPLDIFDISDLEKGVSHLSRLQFEGWISKSIPLTIAGRQFILGLGWVVPMVNNESNMRHPQAMLFEIKKVGAGFKAFEVSQLNFAGSNIWTDFNSADKFIEVRENGDGSGQILFSASSFDNGNYQTGGKTLNFDLRTILAGQPEKAITEGLFLAGKSDWIRRVFTNTEIDRINTFSDMALGVFNTKTEGDAKLVRASAVLELARNIRGYEALTGQSGHRGVQIISEYSWGSNDEISKTKLRLVSADRADEEKSKVISELEIPGSYSDSLVVDNHLFVLGSHYSYKHLPNNTFESKRFGYIAVVKLSDDGQKLEILSSKEMVADESNPAVRRLSLMGMGRYGSQGLVKLPSGRVAFEFSGKIYETGSSVQITELSLSSCDDPTRIASGLKAIGGEVYYASATEKAVDGFPNLNATKNYIAKIQDVNGALSCAPAINIPGEILAAHGSSAFMVEDTWAQDLVIKQQAYGDKPFYTEVKTTTSILGLVMKEGKAVLVDELELGGRGYQQNHQTLPGQIVRIGNFGQTTRNRFNSADQTSNSLETISVDETGFITKEERVLDLGVPAANVSIAKIVSDSKLAGQFLGLIKNGKKLHVVSWTNEDRKPKLLQIVGVNEKLVRQASGTSTQSLSWWGSEGAHFSEELRSFVVPEGASGLTQVFLAE